MSKNLNDALAILPHLGPKDLATVRGAIDHLLAKRVEDDPTAPLFGMVANLLGVNLGFHSFRNNSQAYKTWKRTAPAYLQFLDQTWPDASKVAKGAITTVILDMILDDMKGQQVPVNLGSVAVWLERAPQLLDQAFPEYRKSGMANVILKAMEKEV